MPSQLVYILLLLVLLRQPFLITSQPNQLGIDAIDQLSSSVTTDGSLGFFLYLINEFDKAEISNSSQSDVTTWLVELSSIYPWDLMINDEHEIKIEQRDESGVFLIIKDWEIELNDFLNKISELEKKTNQLLEKIDSDSETDGLLSGCKVSPDDLSIVQSDIQNGLFGYDIKRFQTNLDQFNTNIIDQSDESSFENFANFLLNYEFPKDSGFNPYLCLTKFSTLEIRKKQDLFVYGILSGILCSMIIAIVCYVVFNQYIKNVMFNQILRRHCEDQNEIKTLVSRDRKLEIQRNKDPDINISNFKEIVKKLYIVELDGFMCQIFGIDHPRCEYDRRKDKFSDISFKRRLEDVKNEMNGLVSFFEEIKYLIELTETEKEKDIRVFKIELIETKTEGEKKKLVIEYRETGMEQLERCNTQASFSCGSNLRGSQVIEDEQNNEPTRNVELLLNSTDSETDPLGKFFSKILLKILEEIRSNPTLITDDLFD